MGRGCSRDEEINAKQMVPASFLRVLLNHFDAVAAAAVYFPIYFALLLKQRFGPPLTVPTLFAPCFWVGWIDVVVGAVNRKHQLHWTLLCN